MKRGLVIGVVLALVVAGDAGAQTVSIEQTPNTDCFLRSLSYDTQCSRTFTARHEPQSFQALSPQWEVYAARWEAADGKRFVAQGSRCVDFGRYRALRVRENVCHGPLIVTVRSVGAPMKVTFRWVRLA